MPKYTGGHATTVQLFTFLQWPTRGLFGYETELRMGRETVTRIWCKSCAKHVDDLISTLQGRVACDFRQFVSGITRVTKHNVMRHLKSKIHLAGEELERRDANSTLLIEHKPTERALKAVSRPEFNTLWNDQIRETYRKLIQTCYMLAARGKPISVYKTVVDIQKVNGVPLHHGPESGKCAAQFLEELSRVIKGKVAKLINQSKFFAVLTDGLQAHKMQSEKQLVLVRLVLDGSPTYLCAGLADVDHYVNVPASDMKKSLDNVFHCLDKVRHSADDYLHKLIAATSDGAAMKTRKYHEVLAELKSDRPWLVTNQCISHRLELAIKQSLMTYCEFVEVRDFIMSVSCYCKSSVTFTRQLNATAEAIGTVAYQFPKVHGTRFLEHQRKGIKILLNNWIILAKTIESSEAYTKRTDARLCGYLKKLQNFAFFANCCLYKDILEIVAVLADKLRQGKLLMFEVGPAIEHVVEELKELLEIDIGRLDVEMIAERCDFKLDHDNGDYVLSCQVHQVVHKRQKIENQKSLSVDYTGMKVSNLCNIGQQVQRLKAKVLPALESSICHQFTLSTADRELYVNTQWLDPANWHDSDVTQELFAIKSVAAHFRIPLEYQGFDDKNLKKEWKNVKHTVRNFYRTMGASSAWAKLIQYRHELFPNICLLVELLLCLGMSNGTVESGSSHLSKMLRDNHLSVRHKTMENLLIIKINDLLWNDEERQEIIDSALNHFRQKHGVSRFYDDDGDHADAVFEADSDLQHDESSSESEDDQFALLSGASDYDSDT